jgi:hypothetical protein
MSRDRGVTCMRARRAAGGPPGRCVRARVARTERNHVARHGPATPPLIGLCVAAVLVRWRVMRPLGRGRPRPRWRQAVMAAAGTPIGRRPTVVSPDRGRA